MQKEYQINLKTESIEKEESLEKTYLQRNRKTNIEGTTEEKEATMKKDLSEEK